MAYITRNDLLSEMSDSQLDNFTDDFGDGSETAANLNTVLQTASDSADGYVASVYTVPFFSPVPTLIKQAALIFACEMLYSRRLTPEERNPFKVRADLFRKMLTEVQKGERPLGSNVARAFLPGAAITTTSPVDGVLR